MGIAHVCEILDKGDFKCPRSISKIAPYLLIFDQYSTYVETK